MKLIWNDKEILSNVAYAVEEATKEGAEMVARDARRLAPKLTGKLRMEIDVRKSVFKDGGYSVYAQGPGNYDRFYAVFVELGTADTAAQPFLRPALRRNKRKIVRTFESKFK